MRRKLLFPLMFLALSGCLIDEAGVGEDQQASIGGVPANGQEHYEAVAAISILLPLKEGEDPDVNKRSVYRYCTGVLVEDKTVLTAASCLWRNVEAELDEDQMDDFLDAASVQVQFGGSSLGAAFTLDATFDDGVMSHKGVTLHRYYDTALRGQNDVALLRLSTSPGLATVGVHTDTITSSIEGQNLELVGYGKNDESGDPRDDFTTRNVITPQITEVTDTRIKAGTLELTSCYADSGGPGFLDFGQGAGPEVVTLNILIGECEADVIRQRIDLYANEFIQPFVDYVSGDCALDASCTDCDYNGVCKEDCETRDWDCEVGAFTGAACTKNGDCEEGGSCIAATDDPAFMYCAKSCVQSEISSCPSGMVCSETNQCIYDGISPGSQGAACVAPGDCRSGFCENLFCANECDPADAGTCDAGAEFLCLPSVTDNVTKVCRIDVRTGGGGFCAISPAGATRDGNRNPFLLGLALLLCLGMVRRRRS